MILARFIYSRNSSLLLQNGSMAHVLNDNTFVKYLIGKNPMFLEYGAPKA